MDTVWASLADVVDAVLLGRLHNPTVVGGSFGCLDGPAARRLRDPPAP